MIEDIQQSLQGDFKSTWDHIKDEGIEIGREEGLSILKKRTQIAIKNMTAAGMRLPEIAKLLGMELSEVEQLYAQINMD